MRDRGRFTCVLTRCPSASFDSPAFAALRGTSLSQTAVAASATSNRLAALTAVVWQNAKRTQLPVPRAD